MPSDLQVTNIKDQANANSAITIASDGQITVNQNNPTVTLGSNATFPTKVTDRTSWYQLFQHNKYPSGYNAYQATLNADDDGSGQTSGAVPTGYSAVASAYVWVLTAQSGTHTYQATMQWAISSNANSITQHSLSATQVYSFSANQDQLWRRSITGIGSSGSRFEDLIAEGDVFGFSIDATSSLDVRLLGIEITWRM
jgi:hypothetical protein